MEESEFDHNEFFKDIVEYETDEDVINEGEACFHSLMHVISSYEDPAFSYIIYRFNRAAIKHPTLDAVMYLDRNDIPTLGINYRRLVKMTPLEQISVVQHQVGHLMCGHLGDRLGYQLRQYCEQKFGMEMGHKIYYLTVEAIADCFVSYPGALKNAGRPYYDIRKLGLPRFDCTMNVLSRVEELLAGSEAGGSSKEEALNELISKMLNSGSWQRGDHDIESNSRKKSVGGLSDDGDTPDEPEDGDDGESSGDPKSGDDSRLKEETGGMDVKDLLCTRSKRDATLSENKIANILKEAIEKTSSYKNRGYLKGDASQIIEALTKPPAVPWFQKLNHAVSSGIAMERRVSKMRLNRRNPDFGFGRVTDNVTRVAFIIDTSGSMGVDELKYVDAELNGIAQNTELDIQLIHCDAGIAKAETYRKGMHLTEFFGRGGTDFTPALTYLKENSPEGLPDITVYFTDGYGGKLNDDNPIIGPWESHLIWVLTPNGLSEENFRNQITQLGEVIKIEDWQT